jgi:glycosyltransferase involved in cell wall biosynthesis
VDGVLPLAPNVKIRRLWPSTYPLWEQLALPLAAHRDELDILHALGNTAPVWLPSHIKLVLSLHDVMFLQSGQLIPKPYTLYQRAGRLYRSLVSPLNAHRSQAVITVSNFSQKDILKFIPGLFKQKVLSIHNACDPQFGLTVPRNKKMNDRPFLLCLGASDPRKNTLKIVQAYLNIIKNHGLEHDLIIAGYQNWENSPSHRLVRKAHAESRVIFRPFLTVDELIMLYQQATALLYISLYEGFGIPILEAFISGCPVIASNTTSIPEVGSDAAIYVDPRLLVD